MYHLDYPRLAADVHNAFLDAKRHKSGKPYVKAFERNLGSNLQALTDELWNRTYQPRPGACFIITYPKKREVFAADFRDRIVHHLYYNYTRELYERTFIADSYSCIPGRGTHYGIRRLEQHIRSESRNYTRPCFVLKMDICGYFMHIDRQRLLDICLSTLRRMAIHRILTHVPVLWRDRLDMDFIEYLTREIVLLDPTASCRIVGQLSEWDGLPHDKSLFHSPKGAGLPIGNLTSQLFSNVYLNELDQYMKRTLGCRHYGRYVDDFYVVSSDRDSLLSIVPQLRSFLQTSLSLTLHDGKTQIIPVQYGVTFLGAFLKPWRKMISRDCFNRMQRKYDNLLQQWHNREIPLERVACAVASFRGVLSHGRNHQALQRMSL